jgi:tRNA pseudouridine55 synthase
MKRRQFKGRNLHGILLLDKPVGIVSNIALQTVKKLYGAKKAGHTGSLDPLATGILPICFGESTKISNFLLNAGKRYRVVIQLGVTTTTGDSEGEVLTEDSVADTITEESVSKLLSGLVGTHEQIPPMFSAIKQNGIPLYKLARQGIEVERKARTIHLYELRFLSYDQCTKRVEFEVSCSKGTYIRTLSEDIGETLGCGAHVTFLRRTGFGVFTIDQAVSLDTVGNLSRSADKSEMDALLVSTDSAIVDMPSVTLSNDSVHYIRQGQPVLVPKSPTQGMVRLYQENLSFVGIGEIIDDGRVAPRRMILSA